MGSLSRTPAGIGTVIQSKLWVSICHVLDRVSPVSTLEILNQSPQSLPLGYVLHGGLIECQILLRIRTSDSE